MNINIKNSKELNKSINTVVIPYIYKNSQINLKNYMKQFVNLNENKQNIDFINNIESQLKKKETNFTLFVNIAGKNCRMFFLNIHLDDIDYNLLKKDYNIVEKDKSIGSIIDAIRIKGANLYSEIIYNSVVELNIGMISNFDENVNKILNNGILEGLLLSSYKYEKYKSIKTNSENIKLINCIYPRLDSLKLKEVDKNVKRMLKQIDTIFLARDMINEPGNTLSSTEFIKTITSYSKSNNIPVFIDVIGRETLKKMGMNLLVSVGEGSEKGYQSQLMVIHYNPKSKKTGIPTKVSDPDYVLIGKGVTFDTGGISLKSGDDTYEMKTDMAGAAVVSCFTIGHALIGGDQSVVCLVPLAENSISNNPTRPGDVIKAYNGKTVEIIDTDAEGRLLIADCLAYSNEKYPKSIVIDFATLTGSQYEFSCKMFSNMFTRHKNLEEHIVDSGDFIQERIVAIPYIKKFERFIESETADLRNISTSDCNSGMMTSAVFLGQFIDEDIEWAHIDMAGPSFKNGVEYMPGDASAIGVRLLYEIIQ